MDVALFPISRSGEALVQPRVAEVRAQVQYLEDAGRRPRSTRWKEHLQAFLASPVRYLKTLMYVAAHKETEEGYAVNSRFESFRQAVYLVQAIRAREASGRKIHRLHAHFAHDPALVAYLAYRLAGIPYSFTAHARDLYQIPIRTLTERIGAARTVVTCCSANLDYLVQQTPAPARGRLKLIHHGVDLHLFRPAADSQRDDEVPVIVSAGRLVEKKGFPDLLTALYLLKQAGTAFRCEIYGGGPLQLELTARIIQLGLQGEVTLAGEYAQDEIVPVLQSASLFALTPSVAEDGDRDGIPNVLVEAMACGLPVVSTSAAGIPELVTHGYNGLLFEPHDTQGISAGLAALLADPTLRARLGKGARQTVEECYDQRSAAVQLAELFADNQGKT